MSDDLRERPQEMFTERQVNKILKSLGARLMSSEELRSAASFEDKPPLPPLPEDEPTTGVDDREECRAILTALESPARGEE